MSHHVYLWLHGPTPVYVGAAKRERRRFDHITPAQTRDGSAKANYFREHRLELRCEVVLDNVTKVEALAHEARLIALYGLACDGTGTLLNTRRQSSALPVYERPPRPRRYAKMFAFLAEAARGKGKASNEEASR
jgi:hypothetical protein